MNKLQQQKQLFSFIWKNQDTMIYGDCGSKDSDKILGLDMDGTIIKVKSGKKFAQNADDWVLWDSTRVQKVLKEYYDNGYRIVIFTNQAGISKGKALEKDITQKIEAITQELQIPILACIATAEDKYRKPCLGMWNFLNSYNKIKINADESVFCGDAAGRNSKQFKDFNDTDLKFALNIGFQFKVPEQLFQNMKEVSIPKLEFNPKLLKDSTSIFVDDKQQKTQKTECIIFVGSAASGKSTFWKNHLSKTHQWINQDTLKTKDKCIKLCEQHLKDKKNVVIDKTNPTKADREIFIKIAQKYDCFITCYIFICTKQLSAHLDQQREVNQARTHLSKRVGMIPIHSFHKYYEEPAESEGFHLIKKINFVPGPFDNNEDEQTFYSYSK